MTDLVATRRSLHGAAELLLAGPQHARSGTIRLIPCADGFATTTEPAASIVRGSLVHDGRTVPLDGRTIAEAAAAVGLTPCSLDDLYQDSTGIGLDERLVIDDEAAAEIAAAFALGHDALQAFHPGETPVLWPEHFDLGITVDEVNYGVSPGDGFLAVPYAYVGPWTPLEGAFWNAPFGAARPLSDLTDLPDLAAWFAEGADLTTKETNR
ncbi:hypothetical protein F0U44_02845 [Nocardioides humilatus]|uniref:Uncharacterized protein n=1 Tax=Nocardioides humilatus TaxID=2607660 RepID=A0A5B1LNU2_9ACTN|nr:hypothetical protein [Nocardioides humilatus]KAA1421267.1 hypothetical protein F0U44_02845 [Nocardioides humilatus]